MATEGQIAVERQAIEGGPSVLGDAVEALGWSGMSATHYATALDIWANSLRRWRDLFDAEAVSIDWWVRLHPSARPPLSTGVSTGA